MKKIIKLTESDLHRIVRRVSKESLGHRINDDQITSTIKTKLVVEEKSSEEDVDSEESTSSKPESSQKEINDYSLTNFITSKLGVKNPSSGTYIYRETTSREYGGKTLLLKHKNGKQTDIINKIQNKQGIPSGNGVWKVNGSKLTFTKK